LEQSVSEFKSIKIDGEDRLERLAKLKDQRAKVEVAVNNIVCLPENIVPFLVPGRFIKINQDDNNTTWGWGVVVSFQKQRINPKKFVMGDSKNKDYLDVISKTEVHYILDVLLYVKNKLTSDNVLQPGDFQKKDGRLGVIPVLLHPQSISCISTIQMNLPGHNLTSAESLKQVEMLYGEIMKRFNQGDDLPMLDPKEDMEIEDE
jgi:ATP-dependent RNA helicase DOB1